MRTASTMIWQMPTPYHEPRALMVDELVTADPDILRDAVFKALSSLADARRADIRKRLLNELKRAGLRLRQTLLMLGVSASTADELTPPEIAALLRYVRLTEPGIMNAILPSVGELLTGAEPAAQSSLAS